MNSVPVPRDIPLPLPAPTYLLEGMLVVSFLAHLLFVNLMVGGSLFVFAFQLVGLRRPEYDRLARAIAATVTVNKSVAVVLGVAPLLTINVVYTIHFYTANALTGTAWILLIPAITAAFLLIYLHKHTWDKLAGNRPTHIAIGGLALSLLLVIPLVFLANANLMLFPERWTDMRGFLGALSLPNVLPRYLHFLSASVVLTALVGAHYFASGRFEVASLGSFFTQASLRRMFLSIAFVVSLAQFIVGPLVLFTLPARGVDARVLSFIGLGAALALPAVWMLWQELQTPHSARRLWVLTGLLGLVVFAMGQGRHFYRVAALEEHKHEMRLATQRWEDDSAQAAFDKRQGLLRAASGVSEGEYIFKTVCSACHAIDRPLVGPSLAEIARLYKDNPGALVAWAKAPGRKRPEVQQMPSFAALGDKKLEAVAGYMLGAAAAP